MRRPFLFLGAAILLWPLLRCAPAAAQLSGFPNKEQLAFPGLADEGQPVTVSAAFSVDQNGRSGRLSVTAEVADEWHIYSMTQAPGGPVRSQIKLPASPDYELAGEFKPSAEPDTHVDNEAYKGLTLEEYSVAVTWTAPIKVTSGVDPTKLKIVGKLFAQACRQGQCLIPQDYAFTAALDPSLAAERKPAPTTPVRVREAPATTGTYQLEDIVFHGYLSPSRITPGGKLSLVIIAEPAAGWHIYELSDKPAATSQGARPTLLVLTETSGLTYGPAVPNQPPVRDAISSLRVHENAVTWTVQLPVPDKAKTGPVKIEGLLAYQICTAENCKKPDALGFSASVAIGDKLVDGQVPLEFISKHTYREVEKLVKNAAGAGGGNARTGGPDKGLLNPDQIKPIGVGGQQSSLAFIISIAFLGGLILNLMPCVLPVIGLKILSFVEQSGHSRQQAFLLNLWYSLGMLAVFMVLATLAVVADFGWGQQFSKVGFVITLTAVVFVMALSFLGVWEIPIPGFAGGRKANELAAREGFYGAFSKGAITTVLATPCSGPFLGTAFGFALAQPPLVVYLIFASIGLGMASPYLLIGAYPQLLRFLPKPGAWMDTFKQVMGFVLLGTVVYLMSLVRSQFFVPTLALLFGLWAACWWVGRTPLYAELPSKLRAWGFGSAFAALIGVFAFQWFQPQDGLAWRPFSLKELTQLTAEGKTVMVDFTADWCPNCKYLERTVLNTTETKEFVERNGIVPMVADLTEYPEEEQTFLRRLGAATIPFMAIFPAGKPNEPIVLPDLYTRGTLFEKLKEAGPSKGSGQVAELAAMNKP